MANPNPNVSNLRPWRPGQPSPNPAGRPKGVAKAFRDVLDPAEAAEGLLALARDETLRAADRISAWNALLDRGYGKAASFAAIEGTDPLEMGDVEAEIRRIADELAAARSAA